MQMQTASRPMPMAIGLTSSLTLIPPIRMVMNMIPPMNNVLDRLPTMIRRQTLNIGT